MKRLITLLSTAILYPLCSSAQIDLCLPVATAKGGAVTALVKDWESIGINPANLGWKDNHKISISILNAGISIQSRALDFQTLMNALTNPGYNFSQSDKQHYAQVFSTHDGLNLFADVNWLAFSIHIPKIGGFAVNVRDRAVGHVTLSPTTADIVFNGDSSQAYKDPNITSQKISHELAGTNVAFYYYRELNLSYGRKLFQIGGSGGGGGASFSFRSMGNEGSADTSDYGAFKVYGGIGLKYLWGLANIEANITDGGLSAHSSASSSFNIDYGNIPNFSVQNVPNLFNNTGNGYAFDIGLSAVYKRWRFAVAATDIGSILWQHNTLTAIDTTMPKLSSGNNGIDSWSGAGLSFLFANSNFMNFKPGPDYSVALPAKLRTGASFELNKRFTFSGDAVFPINNVTGNLENPYYAVAGQFNLYKSLYISTGFGGNQNFGFVMPLGLTFGFKNYVQFYLATNDILTFLERSTNPNISAAFGMLRFNL